MTDHYYSSKPNTEHDLRLIKETLRGYSFEFWTDAGVFSKGGIDFGSKLLIETMDIPETGSILDVGCGYGPIGISASRLASKGSVLMVDINQRAISLAQRNILLNGITNATALVSDLFEQIRGRRFDRILTNPPIRAGKNVVHQIFADAAESLTESGELWVVIQKKQGAPSAKKKLEELFEEVEDMARDAGYRIFRCKKPKSFT